MQQRDGQGISWIWSSICATAELVKASVGNEGPYVQQQSWSRYQMEMKVHVCNNRDGQGASWQWRFIMWNNRADQGTGSKPTAKSQTIIQDIQPLRESSRCYFKVALDICEQLTDRISGGKTSQTYAIWQEAWLSPQEVKEIGIGRASRKCSVWYV